MPVGLTSRLRVSAVIRTTEPCTVLALDLGSTGGGYTLLVNGEAVRQGAYNSAKQVQQIGYNIFPWTGVWDVVYEKTHYGSRASFGVGRALGWWEVAVGEHQSNAWHGIADRTWRKAVSEGMGCQLPKGRTELKRWSVDLAKLLGLVGIKCKNDHVADSALIGLGWLFEQGLVEPCQ